MTIMAMPKKGYGPRPIGILSPIDRTIYEALVNRLIIHLPPSSRDGGIETHRAFGLDSTDQDARVVDLDIAACYEYIDHKILADEILMQSLDPAGTRALTAFLNDLFPRSVGLPQAMAASHALADAYLERIVRGIQRGGYQVNRYADDFRIVARNWADSHLALELVVTEARNIGLTLADGKTRISSRDALLAEIQERQNLYDQYKSDAADELRYIDFTDNGYDDVVIEEKEAPEEEVDFATLRRIVEDWITSQSDPRALHASFGSRALQVLAAAPERIPDEWLLRIVAREPRRLRSVLAYISRRGESEENWKTLELLSQQPRRSPWSRVWLLATADELQSRDANTTAELMEWATGCLRDNSEVVRAEAAWLLAHTHSVNGDDLASIFVESTPITRFGVAAAAGRLDGATPSKVGKALRADSRVARAAYMWGTDHAS
ncbi:reverse transcriptase domain-containing protein [Sanguibacter sp. A247]|uniref:reverse transcriptase domain-containing protein n=1 Tax=unclassified Sanguibacter TaxID=2645534 RepID=UPI003FD70EB6